MALFRSYCGRRIRVGTLGRLLARGATAGAFDPDPVTGDWAARLAGGGPDAYKAYTEGLVGRRAEGDVHHQKRNPSP